MLLHKMNNKIENQNTPPLCVDLDGTLVKLDTLHQSILLLIRRKPKSIFKIIKWIQAGRASLKEEVTKRVSIDAAHLPYNNKLLNFLKNEKDKGRKLVLVTGANFRTANAVANHLQIFDHVMSSSESFNLFGPEKPKMILNKYNEYDYAGDSIHDLPAFNAARKKLFVNPSRSLLKYKYDTLIEEKKSKLKSIFESLRINQWIKNILIFLPVLLAHKLHQDIFFNQCIIAFFSFSLTASAIYIFNDLLDISADQHHPRKKYRPIAIGNIQIQFAIYMIPLLLISSFIFLHFLPNRESMAFVLILYILTAFLYSLKFKQIIFFDVILLTLFYNTRIIIGGKCSDTVISSWFFLFTFFLFLNLALLKRYGSLVEFNEEKTAQQERGYLLKHRKVLKFLGIATGLFSFLILSMYSFSDQVKILYNNPLFINFTSPLILCWLIRMWKIADKNLMSNDPLIFASKDFVSYIIFFSITLLFILGALNS